jgi:hypothetical protein
MPQRGLVSSRPNVQDYGKEAVKKSGGRSPIVHFRQSLSAKKEPFRLIVDANTLRYTFGFRWRTG